MKIVFISTDKSIIVNNNGDAFNRHREYAKHFEELTVIIFCLRKDKLQGKRWKNLRIIPTNSKSRWGFIFDSLKILNHLQKPDIISAQDPFVTALVGLISKMRWGVKFNIQLHNDYFDTKYFRMESLQNIIFYWLGKLNLLFADSVRAVSKRLKGQYVSFIAPVPTDLGYFWHPVHKKRYHTIVTVARLEKQKNIPLLVAAAAEIVNRMPQKKFVIIGEGSQTRNIKDLIRKHNLSGKVLLVGQKSRAEVKSQLRKSDLFVLSSNYEGWGISVIEALASGLPVVMTDTGCAGEVVVHQKIGGLVVPQGNKDKLVSAIESLSLDGKLAASLVERAQKLLRAKFSQPQLIKKFVLGLQMAP